ncbi:hypothetical protein D1610_03525 [Sphingomonas gilva]|uniref:Glycosyltransferase RgtA/B/C/D-like domain-containing protein n=1 Tax=Sphingomonas gilva TaxID=2305907 RepID=A0A396RZL5_9SPHN|nr:glycosyltransferase family 39 protein [Sphingomonas gilva]RHW19191.1 hypothetical protein D1610_03525 [Sphingomonas gilva]
MRSASVMASANDELPWPVREANVATQRTARPDIHHDNPSASKCQTSKGRTNYVLHVAPPPAGHSMSDILARQQSTRVETGPFATPYPRTDRMVFQLGILLLVAFLLRVWQFGNPVLHVDDQFYLLMGDRMLQGDLPYVDIWDRKPIGLFLIYAAIRLLGGGGIVEYQIVATLFATATAFVIARIGMRIGSTFGGVSAGIAYLCWLMLFGGDGGQSPVFYNLFMAAAALKAMTALAETSPAPRDLAKDGAVVMLLAGSAMQVKYTALFEGIFFGLVLMWAAWRVFRRPAPVLTLAAAWVAIALAPTALAWAVYAWLGHSDAFFFANFLSIFDRPPSPTRDLMSRLGLMAMYSAPLWLCVIAVMRGRFYSGATLPTAGARTFVLAWLAAATLGLLIFGTYYDHYFLPVLVPLTAAIAPLMGAPGTGMNLFVLNGRQVTTPLIIVMAIPALIMTKIQIYDNIKSRGDGSGIDRIAEVAAPRLGDGCLFVFDNEPILYYKTNSCLNSPYAFPPHLSSVWEDDATGVNTLEEVGRILARKPPVIVTSAEIENEPNLSTWRLVRSAIARDYRLIHSEPIGYRTRVVYERLPRS